MSIAAVRERIAAACAAAGRSADLVALCAVSKKQPTEKIRAAYAEGQRDFGENRVQELVAKAAELADFEGLRWHFVGSLQTNKVRELLQVPGLHLLHSLDRKKLARELSHELDRVDRELNVLLQIHATDEPSKHGCAPEQAPELLDYVLGTCPRLEVKGVMAMGPLEADPRPAFELAAGLREELARRCDVQLPILSLGMTDDLEAAVAKGSTMVRIGTAVFGPRPTSQ